MKIMNTQKGFTLVEIMVALVMSGIVLVAVYSTYTVQNIAATRQQQMADLQAEVRFAIYNMVQEIRMAGYDPTESASSAITAADDKSISFSMDLNRDGDTADTNETITYNYDSTNKKITRSTSGGTAQPFAQNIAAFELLYTLAGSPQTQELKPATTALGDIRAITVSIVAESPVTDDSFTETDNDTKYQSAAQIAGIANASWPDIAAWNTDTDYIHRHKRMLITTIQCRNMDL